MLKKWDEFFNETEQVRHAIYNPVTDSVWRTIQDEWLDEETGVKDRDLWKFMKLKISDNDKTLLEALDDDIIEKYNRFDIALKAEFKMRCIDFIDYDKWVIRVVTYSKL